MKNIKKILATGALAAVMALGVAAPVMSVSADESKMAVTCTEHSDAAHLNASKIIDEDWIGYKVNGVFYGTDGGVAEYKDTPTTLGMGSFALCKLDAGWYYYDAVGEMYCPCTGEHEVKGEEEEEEEASFSIVLVVTQSIMAFIVALLTILYWIGKIFVPGN